MFSKLGVRPWCVYRKVLKSVMSIFGSQIIGNSLRGSQIPISEWQIYSNTSFDNLWFLLRNFFNGLSVWKYFSHRDLKIIIIFYKPWTNQLAIGWIFIIHFDLKKKKSIWKSDKNTKVLVIGAISLLWLAYWRCLCRIMANVVFHQEFHY